MDKIIERTINLIQLLYSCNKFVTAAELAKTIGLSSKTVKIELKYLSEYLKEHNYGLFITKQDTKYYLERDPVHYLDSLILSLNQKSTYFFMTEHLFYSNSNLRESFNENYYSDSYFYKSKNRYKHKLEKIGLNILLFQNQLIGDERVIRFYFYTFYWHNYGKIEWPFVHVKKDQAMEMVIKIEQSINIRFTEIERLKLAYWIAIIVNRTINKNKLNTKKLNHVKDKTDSNWIEFIFLNQIKVDRQTLKQEHNFLLSMLLLIVDSKNFEKLIREEKLVYQAGDILDFSIQICQKIEKCFCLKKGLDWKIIIYEVYRSVYNQMILNGKFNEYVSNYKDDQSIYPLFNEMYQTFISEWGDSTNDLWDDYLQNPKIWKELKYVVLNSIDIKGYQPKLKIYLCLTKGKLEELIVMEYLSNLNYNLSFENDLTSSIDLIITDIYYKRKEMAERYFYWNETSIENNVVCLENFFKRLPIHN